MAVIGVAEWMGLSRGYEWSRMTARSWSHG